MRKFFFPLFSLPFFLSFSSFCLDLSGSHSSELLLKTQRVSLGQKVSKKAPSLRPEESLPHSAGQRSTAKTTHHVLVFFHMLLIFRDTDLFLLKPINWKRKGKGRMCRVPSQMAGRQNSCMMVCSGKFKSLSFAKQHGKQERKC